MSHQEEVHLIPSNDDDNGKRDAPNDAEHDANAYGEAPNKANLTQMLARGSSILSAISQSSFVLREAGACIIRNEAVAVEEQLRRLERMKRARYDDGHDRRNQPRKRHRPSNNHALLDEEKRGNAESMLSSLILEKATRTKKMSLLLRKIEIMHQMLIRDITVVAAEAEAEAASPPPAEPPSD